MDLKVEKKIKIERKRSATQYAQMLRASNTENQKSKRYIGGSTDESGLLRGLTFAEEKVYLKHLLGIDPTANDWQKATNTYWHNFSVNIPSDGLELEVGFHYSDEASKKKAEKMEANTVIERKGISRKNQNEENEADKYKLVEAGLAFPINIEHYVTWRYALVYSRVSNKLAWVNNSPNILFVIYDEHEELGKQAKLETEKAKAAAAFLALIADKTKARNVARLFKSIAFEFKEIAEYPILDKLLLNIEDLKDDEIVLILSAIKEVRTSEFLGFIENPDLELRAKIEAYISARILRRLDNSDIIMYDNTTIGASIESVLLFFKSTEQTAVAKINEIKAKYSAIISGIKKE